MDADRVVALLEELMAERTVLAVSPEEAGRRLCPDDPVSGRTIRRLVAAGHIARVPYTDRVLIPLVELRRFALSGMSTEEAA